MSANPLLTALTALIVLGGSVSPLGATTRHPLDVQERNALTNCIQRASIGHAWLEKTLWGLSDQEAGWIGAEIPNTDGSFDLGPLQINSWWVPRIAKATRRPASSVRWWLIHDPCFNVEAARWIFLSGLARRQNYWEAVGAYHSPTTWRQRAYVAGVAARLQRRFGPAAFSLQRSVR